MELEILTGELSNKILVLSTVGLIAVVLILAWLGRRQLGVVPSGLGAIFEHVYDFVNDTSHSFMGEKGERYTPFAMSIFLFVLMSNWSGLIPMPEISFRDAHGLHPHLIYETPTASYNTTLALALVSFLAFTYFGIRQKICGDPQPEPKEAVTVSPQGGAEAEVQAGEAGEAGDHHAQPGHGLFKGFGVWLVHYLGPVPMLWHQLTGAMRYLLLPVFAVLFCFLNIVEELARILSLSFRLYGNVYGEHQVKANLLESAHKFFAKLWTAGSTPGELVQGLLLGLLMWGISIFAMCIGTLAGFIQAFIFCILTLSYISHIVVDEH